MIRIRIRAFKPPVLAMGFIAVLLAACEPGAPTPNAAAAAKPDSAEAGYLGPPTLLSARRAANGIVISGQASPDADLRLGSPTGEVMMAKVDGLGQWNVTVHWAGINTSTGVEESWKQDFELRFFTSLEENR